jgi:DNA invertase Pin-like site-specific DNA recombinase
MDFASYTRVSGAEQASKETSLDHQRTTIDGWARDNGHRIAERFEDAGVTGMTVERPGLQAMVAAAMAGKVEGVAFYDVSRLGRTPETLTLRDRLRGAGIAVVFVFEGYGAGDDPYAHEDQEGQSATDATRESRRKSRETPGRMRAALVGGKSQGVGGRPPFGYSVQETIETQTSQGRTRRVIVPKFVSDENAPYVLRAFELYAEGASTRDVAAYLEPFRGTLMHVSNVSRMLRNVVYTGARAIGITQRRKQRVGGKVKTKYMSPDTWAICKNTHVAIVPQDLFQRVQARLDAVTAGRNRTRVQQDGNPFPQGLLRCANCGGAVELHKSVRPPYNHNEVYLMCRNRRMRRVGQGDPKCQGAALFSYAKARTLARIALLCEGEELDRALATSVHKPNPEIAALEKQLGAAQKKVAARLAAIDAGGEDIPELVTALRDAREKSIQLDQRLKALRAVEPKRVSRETVHAHAQAIKKAFEAADMASVRGIIADVFSSIRIDFPIATALRDAERTLRAVRMRKSKVQTAAAKFDAAQTIDRIMWTVTGGPIEFVGVWERGLWEKIVAESTSRSRGTSTAATAGH